MRTTLTLDPDVAMLLREAVRAREVSFKQVVNDALRNGLSPRQRAPKPFRQRTASLGAEQHFNWDKALETAAALEDEELVRKMSLRK